MVGRGASCCDACAPGACPATVRCCHAAAPATCVIETADQCAADAGRDLGPGTCVVDTCTSVTTSSSSTSTSIGLLPLPTTTVTVTTSSTSPGATPTTVGGNGMVCAGTTLSVDVALVAQAGSPPIAGLTVEVAYAPPLAIPGSGLVASVRQRVMDLTGGV